ncbi:hypothetical protein TNCT_553861 [Trichonephila clavata]|uniref:SPOC domain-containing protein n=1 Tax=Trichonephila clavata TaxID=2740835 RepID=A0A8X6KJH5_TRICU|nr:hypothetical protein TNCT_553861 [Trichonephila clavata]
MDAAEALERSSVVWHGWFILRQNEIPIELHFVSGNSNFPIQCLSFEGPSANRVLEVQPLHKVKEFDFVHLNKRLQNLHEHCVLVGIPDESYTTYPMNKYLKAQQLHTYFVFFLKSKKSFGAIQLKRKEGSFTLYIFPNCEYSNMVLYRRVPEKMASLEDAAYLLFVIVKDK